MQPRPAAPNEQGLTVTHMLTAVVGIGVAMVALFLAIKPASPGRSAPQATTPAAVQPVLGTLQRDVSRTVHAILLDTGGCGHKPQQRVVVSFLADGSAPARASWYVERHGGESQLVHRECRNGAVAASTVVTAAEGRPLVACTPSCGRFQSVRFSYDGPNGLTTVVAYRRGAK